MRGIDFAVIGAQKAGTTSLRHYLRPHPGIFVPDDEAPYFTRESLYNLGWKSFINSFFSAADRMLMWGVVSPQYMGDLRAPSRLYEHNPKLKLIALLRDPIERARSHHRMATRRQEETRSFEEAALALLDQHEVSLAPPPPETECYLAWSRYGLVLCKYLEYFDREQVLIINSEDLRSRRKITVEKIYSFLGVRKKFVPSNIQRAYHSSDSHDVLSLLRRVARKVGLRTAWDAVLSRSSKDKIYSYMLSIISLAKMGSGYNSGDIPPDLDRRLVRYFSEDLNILKSHFDVSIPWKKYVASEVE